MRTADPRPPLAARATVTLDWHCRSATTAELTMLYVPRALGRRQGHGRAAYEAWERALPDTVTTIWLWVADTDGQGRPFGFWDAMGYMPLYTDTPDAPLSYEDAGWMHKARTLWPDSPRPA